MNLTAPIPLTGTAAAPRAASTPEDRARIEQVARDLEGQFAQMMVKSMRDAGFGDTMHFRGPYLEFHRRSVGPDERGVK